MSRKNVMHITYDMRIGGTEMVIKNIIEARDASQFQMSIFCIEEPLGPWGETLRNTGVSILCRSRKSGFDISLIKTIHKAIKQQKIDIVHCHQYTPWVYGALAAVGTKVKVIFTEHGRFYPDSSSWKRRFVNPILSLMTAKITAISKATKKALVDYEFLSEDKIEVIYNGIKPLVASPPKVQKLRKGLTTSEQTRILGTVARFDPIKNQTMMIRAFSKVLEYFPDTYLMLVGDGDERKNLAYLIEELDISDKVILTGYVKEPVNHIEMMDIFLLSSLSEGTSMTLLEAMSLSKPCVVTDAGGNREVINNKVSGLVTQNNDIHGFANAIFQLLSNNQMILELGENSKARFDHLFNDSIMNKQYHKLYEQV